jgi:hypothetical protein
MVAKDSQQNDTIGTPSIVFDMSASTSLRVVQHHSDEPTSEAVRGDLDKLFFYQSLPSKSLFLYVDF